MLNCIKCTTLYLFKVTQFYSSEKRNAIVLLMALREVLLHSCMHCLPVVIKQN